MTRKIDMHGCRFGLLTVVAEAGRSGKQVTWRCRCDCGGEVVVLGNNLRRGNSKSCGCHKAAVLDVLKFKPRHGISDTRVHRSWMSMRQRCENPHDRAYRNYGGRGIKVCERWQTFENFMADMGSMPDGMTLERIDVNGDYEPANCRWATYREQARNTRVTRWIEHAGVRRSLAEWSSITGIKAHTISHRLLRGVSVADALTRSVSGKQAHPVRVL